MLLAERRSRCACTVAAASHSRARRRHGTLGTRRASRRPPPPRRQQRPGSRGSARARGRALRPTAPDCTLECPEPGRRTFWKSESRPGMEVAGVGRGLAAPPPVSSSRSSSPSASDVTGSRPVSCSTAGTAARRQRPGGRLVVRLPTGCARLRSRAQPGGSRRSPPAAPRTAARLHGCTARCRCRCRCHAHTGGVRLPLLRRAGRSRRQGRVARRRQAPPPPPAAARRHGLAMPCSALQARPGTGRASPALAP